MTGIWPWLAVAGVGALHGLNPASGWMFATAWSVHSRDRAQALRALLPIGLGHAVSMGLVLGAVALGQWMDRVAMQVVAGGLLVAVVAHYLMGHNSARVRMPGGSAGLALWSFLVSSAHGAGLMLVPALMPLCAGNAAGREISVSGSLVTALTVVGIHTAAMLATTALVTIGACHGLGLSVGLIRKFRQRDYSPPGGRISRSLTPFNLRRLDRTTR